MLPSCGVEESRLPTSIQIFQVLYSHSVLFPSSCARVSNLIFAFNCCSWHTALLGSVWCLAMMFLIDWISSLVFVMATVVLVVYISQSRARKDWGDALSGLLFQQVANDCMLHVQRH